MKNSYFKRALIFLLIIANITGCVSKQKNDERLKGLKLYNIDDQEQEVKMLGDCRGWDIKTMTGEDWDYFLEFYQSKLNNEYEVAAVMTMLEFYVKYWAFDDRYYDRIKLEDLDETCYRMWAYDIPRDMKERCENLRGYFKKISPNYCEYYDNNSIHIEDKNGNLYGDYYWIPVFEKLSTQEEFFRMLTGELYFDFVANNLDGGYNELIDKEIRIYILNDNYMTQVYGVNGTLKYQGHRVMINGSVTEAKKYFDYWLKYQEKKENEES